MNFFILSFYLMEACIIVKDFVENCFLTMIKTFPFLEKVNKQVYNFALYWHNQFYMIRMEPDSPIWLSVSYCRPIHKTHATLIHDENEPLKTMFVEKYFFPESMISEKGFLKSIAYLDPTVEMYLYDIQSALSNRMFLPMYILKNIARTGPDEGCWQYMILHKDPRLTPNMQSLIDKLNHSATLQWTQSKLRFLSIEYSHPEMNYRIQIEIPQSMMYVGNELLSCTFVHRFLEYGVGFGFAFDDRYRIIIMTRDIQMIELRSDQYLLLDSETSYQVKNPWIRSD